MHDAPARRVNPKGGTETRGERGKGGGGGDGGGDGDSRREVEYEEEKVMVEEETVERGEEEWRRGVSATNYKIKPKFF
ncbi:hypothetical protein M0802_000270 [Mischocyttarus mexicanus]|nr:hypothetical protein M0802_000270 [Mischocyttarus mexicanus]